MQWNKPNKQSNMSGILKEANQCLWWKRQWWRWTACDWPLVWIFSLNEVCEGIPSPHLKNIPWFAKRAFAFSHNFFFFFNHPEELVETTVERESSGMDATPLRTRGLHILLCIPEICTSLKTIIVDNKYFAMRWFAWGKSSDWEFSCPRDVTTIW